MKNEQKEKPSKDGQSPKKILTEKEQKLCEEFTEYRHRYGMNQKDWAKTVGISYGLVKRIENQTITCSKKTWDLVMQFVNSCESPPNSYDTHSLEDRVLYDIFITNMGKLTKKEAATYAIKCTCSLRDTLSKVSECSSPEAQKRYFEMINAFFEALYTTACDSLEIINKGTHMPDFKGKIVQDTKRLIANAAHPKKTGKAEDSTEKDTGGSRQTTLAELGI